MTYQIVLNRTLKQGKNLKFRKLLYLLKGKFKAHHVGKYWIQKALERDGKGKKVILEKNTLFLVLFFIDSFT